jgi:glycosyltransferase 2 family protein
MKAFLVFLLKLALTAVCLWLGVFPSGIHHSVSPRRARWTTAGWQPASRSPDSRWFCWVSAGGFSCAAKACRSSLGRAVELIMIDGLFSLASVSGLGGDAARIILLMRDHPDRKLVIAMTVMADHLAGMVSLALLFFIISAARFDALAGSQRARPRRDPLRVVLSRRRARAGGDDLHLRLAAIPPPDPRERPLRPLAIDEAHSGVI